MQKIEYGANKRVSPATVELLMRERSKGKSLRQLGNMFGRSHEEIRQILAKYGSPQVTLLPEEKAAAELGYGDMAHAAEKRRYYQADKARVLALL